MRRIISKLVNHTPSAIAHVMPPLFLSLINEDLILLSLTILYCTYQLIDYLSGEDPRETSIDIVEYSAGMMLGLIVRLVTQ